MTKERAITGEQHSLGVQQRLAAAAAAILIGAFMVLGVGFAHSATIHNAAHDARHAFAFPCH